jgi:uncharacterized protein YacL (UPF0231 family)
MSIGQRLRDRVKDADNGRLQHDHELWLSAINSRMSEMDSAALKGLSAVRFDDYNQAETALRNNFRDWSLLGHDVTIVRDAVKITMRRNYIEYSWYRSDELIGDI